MHSPDLQAVRRFDLGPSQPGQPGNHATPIGPAIARVPGNWNPLADVTATLAHQSEWQEVDPGSLPQMVRTRRRIPDRSERRVPARSRASNRKPRAADQPHHMFLMQPLRHRRRGRHSPI